MKASANPQRIDQRYPNPYTLHPTPYTLNPTPETLHPFHYFFWISGRSAEVSSAMWGLAEGKGVWRKERSERHQRTLKPFSRNQSSLRHHSKPSTLRRQTECSGKKQKQRQGPKQRRKASSGLLRVHIVRAKRPEACGSGGVLLQVPCQLPFQPSYTFFFFTQRARAGTQGMLREAQSARKRQERADKGRNRAQTAEKGSKGAEKGPKSRVFFFGDRKRRKRDRRGGLGRHVCRRMLT